jgi:hypothetical protein
MQPRLFGTLACFAALATLGCGATMESPTEVQSLRILGVQKDKPYAVPGDDVTLTMLWHDGSVGGEHDWTPEADTRREVRIAWLGGCLNPPGDSYSGCYQQYAGAFANGGLPSAGSGDGTGSAITVGDGPKFTVHIPTEAENGAPVLHPSQDPKLPLYGISYVFFALCAGKVVPGDEHFPIHCVGEDGSELGPNDFVLGYSSIYFFAPRSDGSPYLNANPSTTGLLFGPDDVTDVTCFGDDCLGSCDETGCRNPAPVQTVDCEAHPTLCMPSCVDDGDPNQCPPHDLRLIIDPSTFEKDQVTNDAYGRDYGEQMWIDYYSTRGKFRSAAKLLNDATTGYNHVNGTQFYAPNVAGNIVMWAVIHDNRGGMSWVGTTLSIQ